MGYVKVVGVGRVASTPYIYLQILKKSLFLKNRFTQTTFEMSGVKTRSSRQLNTPATTLNSWPVDLSVRSSVMQCQRKEL